MLALAGVLFSIGWIILGPVLGVPFAYVFGLGYVFAIRMIVLVAVVDYRIPRMILPAATQTLASAVCGLVLFGSDLIMPLIVSVGTFGVCLTMFVFQMSAQRCWVRAKCESPLTLQLHEPLAD